MGIRWRVITFIGMYSTWESNGESDYLYRYVQLESDGE